jgi:hypothetical protein
LRALASGKAFALGVEMVHRALLAVLLAAALVLSPTEASARGKGEKCRAEHDTGIGSFEGLTEVLRVPSLVVNGDDTPRRLVGVTTPPSTEALMGGGFNIEIRCEFLLWQLASLRFMTSVGGGASGTTAADDTTASAGRGGVSVLDIGLPSFAGLGGFEVFPTDTLKVGGKLDFGVERLWASGLVSGAGVLPSPGFITSWSVYARVEGSACLRLSDKPGGVSTNWGCLVLAPVIYAQSAFPGIAAGFRVDL